MNAKLSIEKVTPSRASELLENLFEGQRPKSDAWIKKMAQDIVQGRWRLTCDCLLLVKGKLANGQNRLAAVVEANRPCEFIIMESNDEELYNVIDSGRKRTIGDVICKTSHYNCVASIAHWVARYDLGVITCSTASASGGHHSKGGVRLTRSDIIEFVHKNTESLVECASLALELYRKNGILAPAQAGALCFIGSRKNKLASQRFITDVYSGDSRADAAWDFREKCLKNKLSKAKFTNGMMFGLGIKCLKSYLNGTRNGNIKIADGEEFPRL